LIKLAAEVAADVDYGMEAILLARLSEDGEPFTGEDPVEVLELEPDDAVVSVGPLKYDLTVRQMVGDELLVQGRVGCEVVFRCARCAQEFSRRVGEKAYMRSYELHDETESVDLTPDMREATLLAFPAYPVCKSECAGLCSTCGKNLNGGPCECTPAENARWGAFRDLGV
jgi:uncharacterized protein